MPDCLERGMTDGSIRPDLNPELTASVIFSTLFGSIRAQLPARENILNLYLSDGFYPETLSIPGKYLEPRPDQSLS
jgi:hypothetical protein